MRTRGWITPLVVLGLAASAVLSVGYSGRIGRYGKPIPSDIPKATLAGILNDPAAFKNREVVLDLSYGSYCCPDDSTCKEGLEGVEVVPEGFPSVKAKTGRPVRVYGTVRVGNRPEEHEEAGKEKATEEHHVVYIEAKGVQLL